MTDNYFFDSTKQIDKQIITTPKQHKLLPDGVYHYTITDAQLQNFAGNNAIPACKAIEMILTIIHEDEIYTIKHHLYNYPGGVKFIQYFLDSTSLCKDKWNATDLIGLKGTIEVNSYKNKYGQERNKVKHFVPLSS